MSRRRNTAGVLSPPPRESVPVAEETPAEAVAALYETHAPMVLRLGLRLAGSLAEAEEIVQETFLAAFRHWRTFDGRSLPSTWLYTIAVRAWHRRNRGSRGRQRRMPSLDAVMPFHDRVVADLREDRPLARAVAREAVAAMEEAVAQLPAAFRLPLLFKELLELSIEDTAAALGLKPQTVKTRLHRARLALRKVMLERVPTKPAPAPSYERQACIDLLEAKLEAMDRGGPFPLERTVVCERCRGVFRELDLSQRLCLAIEGEGGRREIEAALRRIRETLPVPAAPARQRRGKAAAREGGRRG
jgi:RNA polymerase sigma-70 factor (ECF subfamily)